MFPNTKCQLCFANWVRASDAQEREHSAEKTGGEQSVPKPRSCQALTLGQKLSSASANARCQAGWGREGWQRDTEEGYPQCRPQQKQRNGGEPHEREPSDQAPIVVPQHLPGAVRGSPGTASAASFPAARADEEAALPAALRSPPGPAEPPPALRHAGEGSAPGAGGEEGGLGGQTGAGGGGPGPGEGARLLPGSGRGGGKGLELRGARLREGNWCLRRLLRGQRPPPPPLLFVPLHLPPPPLLPPPPPGILPQLQRGRGG